MAMRENKSTVCLGSTYNLTFWRSLRTPIYFRSENDLAYAMQLDKIYSVGYFIFHAGIDSSSKNTSEIFLGGFYMGILVNFALVKFFRHVKHREQAPEHLCATRMIVASCAQKERRKKSKFTCAKNLKTDSPAPYFWPITILLVTKPPTGIGLVLSKYKRDSHEIWF